METITNCFPDAHLKSVLHITMYSTLAPKIYSIKSMFPLIQSPFVKLTQLAKFPAAA